MSHSRIYILLCLLFCAGRMSAQTLSAQAPGALIVDLDMQHGVVKDDASVPYATPLLFRALLPDPDKLYLGELHLFYTSGLCQTLPDDKVSNNYTFISDWSIPNKTIGGLTDRAEFLGEVRPLFFLRPNRSYCLLIRRFKDENKPDPIQQTISIRTQAAFEDYVKLDFGVGYAFRPNTLFASLAAHVYLVPVHDAVDLAYRFPVGRQLLMRTSIFAGIAPVTFFAGAKQEITSSTGVGNVVFGIGFRGPFYYPSMRRRPEQRQNAKLGLQSMRLNVGWLLFKQVNTNPLISDSRAKVAPYISLTYDFKLTSILGPIGSLFGAK